MATSLVLDEPVPALPTPPVSHPGIRRALGHLHEHYTERTSLGELAGIARLFRAQTGMTPGGYLRHLRIEHAKMLLRHGMPISRVAFTTGFYDQSHFTRRFKRDVGLPPGRFARVTETGQELVTA